MGLFDKIKKTPTDDYFLAIDIGTEIVKVLVVQRKPQIKKGIIVGVGRVKQKDGNMYSGAISDISGVIDATRAAIDEAMEKAGVSKVKTGIIGIAGELVKGTTTTVHYERKYSDQKIDLPELKNIIHKVQWKAYERIRKQLSWEIGKDIDIKLINAAIVDVRIDGYRVTNPLDFQGKSVSISIFNAYAPLLHLGALESIADEVGVGLLSIAAEPYAVSSSVGYEDLVDFNAIFIDIGGGTTDVAVVRNGGLEGTKMFALGGRAFTKKVSHEFRIDYRDAELLKLKYAKGAVSEEAATQLNKVLKRDAEVWLGGVELSLQEFAESDVLPSTIYLCGGGSALPEIKEVLSSDVLAKRLPFAKPPEVKFLQPRDVAQMHDNTNELTNPQDVTPMALARLAIDIVDEERVLAMILRRAMRSIQE